MSAIYFALNYRFNMDFKTYNIEFTTKASLHGYSKENIDKCLNYVQPLLERKLPIIYNTTHFCALVGYKRRYINRAVIYTSYFYRDFEIPKKNNTVRKISEPLPSLKEIQYWILENILENIKISAFAKAYKKKTKLKENVRFHTNQKLVVNFDIIDFFPSIQLEQIEKIFINFGYSPLLSNLFAKLCTRNKELPQGAPTSPYLSNIFFKPIDDLIGDFCISRQIKYTRFADDLSFSGNFDVDELKSFIETTLNRFKLYLNTKKTKILRKNQRQIVTGVVVNDKTQVPFYIRNKIRQQMFFINKFGVISHKEKLKIKKDFYIPHLLGKINFILQMNPDDKEFIEYKKQLLVEKNLHPFS